MVAWDVNFDMGGGGGRDNKDADAGSSGCFGAVCVDGNVRREEGEVNNGGEGEGGGVDKFRIWKGGLRVIKGDIRRGVGASTNDGF
jgi:hypothetical protein